MRRCDHIWERYEFFRNRLVRRIAFAEINIKPSAGEPACLQCVQEGLVVDEAATRGVDQNGRGLHERKCIATYQETRLRR